MKVRVDPSLCQGHGFCYMNAPELFTDDDIGHAAVRLSDELSQSQQELARSASWTCPELAISLLD